MVKHTSPKGASAVLANLGKLLPDLEALYKDIHAHPELSMQETRTAGIAAERLRKSRLRGDDRRGQDGCGRTAPQRQGADSDAARGHGCAADRREHRPCLCEQGHSKGCSREHRAGGTYVRPRHACRLAGRCGDIAVAGARRLEGHVDGGLPAG